MVPGLAQLWRLLVVASVDPRLWAEKGTDGGELVKVKPRQLDGLVKIGRQGVRESSREGWGSKRMPGFDQSQSWAVTSTVGLRDFLGASQRGSSRRAVAGCGVSRTG